MYFTLLIQSIAVKVGEIENVLEKDGGTWKCNMDLVDKQSNSHTINKVIDLNIRNRRESPKKKRRNDPFSLYGSYGDDGSGSGSGPGDEDEIPRGAQLWLNERDKYYFKHLNKVPSQLVEGRLRKPFMTGYW